MLKVDRETESKQPSRDPLALQVFSAIVVFTVIWRFIFIPSNFGGGFLQVWLSGLGFAALYNSTLTENKLTAKIFAPLMGLTIFAANYFGMPVLILTLVPLGLCAMALLAKDPVKMTAAWTIFVVGLGGYLVLFAMMQSHYFKMCFADSDSIEKIVFSELEEEYPKKGEKPKKLGYLEIIDPETTKAIGESLWYTYSYAPNHEGIHQRWHVSIHFKDGSALEFRVGKGNRVDPKTAWIKIGGNYQNPALGKVLNGPLVELWKKDPDDPKNSIYQEKPLPQSSDEVSD